MKIKQILISWKNVFGNLKYLVITIFVAFVFYSINVFVSNIKNLTALYSTFGFFKTLKFFAVLWLGFKSTVIWHSFISLILISILFGMFISLVLYKSRFNIQKNKKVGLFGGIGLFLGVLAPGCVACGIGLASLLGFGAGALAFLPYEGLELSILSIILLSFVILKTSIDLYKCNIPLRKKIKLKGGKNEG